MYVGIISNKILILHNYFTYVGGSKVLRECDCDIIRNSIFIAKMQNQNYNIV